MTLELETVTIEKPEDVNLILGQSHFIKTVEDLYEALAGSSPHLRFGLAFCEASGPCLVRRAGNDAELVELPVRNALAIGAGHAFIVFLREATRSTCSTRSSRYPRSATSSARRPTRSRWFSV